MRQKNNKTRSFISGGQVFFYKATMFFQNLRRMWKWALAIYLIIVGATLWYLTPYNDIAAIGMGIYSRLLDTFYLGNMIVHTHPQDPSITLTAHHVATNPIDYADFWRCLSDLLKHTFMSIGLGILLFMLAGIFFTRKFITMGDRNTKDEYISGITLAKNTAETIKSVKNSTQGQSDIELLSCLPMPRYSETQGLFIHGSIGTGKTQAIMYLLDQIKQAGDIAIVYDKESTLKPYFFDPQKDKELNPLSEHCEHWDIWSECQTPIAMNALATYLMPKAVQGSDPFWVDAARTIFTTVAWKMRDQADKTAIKLLQVLLTTSLDELRTLLKGTEAENLVSEDIEKTAISIRAVMATYTKSLRFLEGLEKIKDKKAFAIKSWVHQQANSENQDKGWLFITSRADFHADIKPLLSAWLGMALKAVQSLPTDSTRRIWVVMDEKASLNRLENFSDIVADIRKFGGCIVLGLQSISQLQFIYGRDEATAITDLQNTSVYFRSPKQRVAEWVSQDLGEQIIEEVRESQSYGPDIVRDGNTISRQRVKRRIVDTGTIMTLENLNCYVRLAGNHPVTKMVLPFKTRAKIMDKPLQERKIDYDAIEKVNAAANKIIKSLEDEKAGQQAETNHTAISNDSKSLETPSEQTLKHTQAQQVTILKQRSR